MKIKIRPAKIEDIPDILQVEKAAWGEKGAANSEFDKKIEIPLY